MPSRKVMRLPALRRLGRVEPERQDPQRRAADPPASAVACCGSVNACRVRSPPWPSRGQLLVDFSDQRVNGGLVQAVRAVLLTSGDVISGGTDDVVGDVRGLHEELSIECLTAP